MGALIEKKQQCCKKDEPFSSFNPLGSKQLITSFFYPYVPTSDHCHWVLDQPDNGTIIRETSHNAGRFGVSL